MMFDDDDNDDIYYHHHHHHHHHVHNDNGQVLALLDLGVALCEKISTRF